MTARRIMVAVLALASLTIGIYAQGGGAQGGGRPAAAAAAGAAAVVRQGHLSRAT